MTENETDGVLFAQPTSHDQRRDVAARCCTELKLTLPTVVDTIDNAVDHAYAAWPERLFVVDRDGLIAFAGAPGPWGYKPDEVERWLRRNVGRKRR